MSSGPKKKFNSRYCELEIVPSFKILWGWDVFVVGDNFGNTFFLGDHMHSPTYLGRIIRNTNNMPKFLVHFGFCTAMTWGKSRPIGGGGRTSSTDEEESLLMVGRGEA